MIRFPALLLAIFALAAPASAQQRQTRATGPNTICGHAFAMRLVAGESAVSERGPDFLLHHVTAADGPFLLYEGNFPQPHDDGIVTGLTFPRLIAIHDNRPAAAKARSRVRDRVLTGDARRAACSLTGGRM
jgi:hypothetical protein